VALPQTYDDHTLMTGTVVYRSSALWAFEDSLRNLLSRNRMLPLIE
jgi:hypothetical protein